MRYTLDHNALIDLEERREPNYTRLRLLLESNHSKVFLTAVSASENPQQRTFGVFLAKVRAIPDLNRIKNENILKPMGIFDFSFHDWSLWGDQAMSNLKCEIADVLFPGLFPLKTFGKKERNKLADVMSFWCHIYHANQVFITSDQNFIRNEASLKKLAQQYNQSLISVISPQNISDL